MEVQGSRPGLRQRPGRHRHGLRRAAGLVPTPSPTAAAGASAVGAPRARGPNEPVLPRGPISATQLHFSNLQQLGKLDLTMTSPLTPPTAAETALVLKAPDAPEIVVAEE